MRWHMLNEERIRLMTKAAEFEQREGKNTFKVNSYFRGDYVSFHMVKAAISGTCAYLVLLALWFVYQMESLLSQLHTMDIQAFILGIVKWYVIFLVIFEVLVFLAYNSRYTKTKEKMKEYYLQLRAIGQLYEREDRRLEGRDTAGGQEDDDYIV